MTCSGVKDRALKSTHGGSHAETSASSSFLGKALCEKVAEFLVVARERTLKEGDSLLPFLSSIREGVASEVGGKEIALKTIDGDVVNGYHFEGSLKKAIIYLHGNGCFYETSTEKPLAWVQALKQPADGETEACPHLLIFNPRGTGKSEGVTHPDTVARDMLAAFEHLVKEHSIDPSDIVIAGHSMGAFFGAFGADLVQQEFPDSEINFLGDRSFNDIHQRADRKLQELGHSRMVRSVYGTAMHSLITLTKWDRNPIAALENLKGRVCIIYHEGDPVVPYDTSQHHALTKAHRTRSYSCLPLKQEELDSDPGPHAHNREFNQEENKLVIAEMKRMLRLPLTEEEESLFMDVLEPNSH